MKQLKLRLSSATLSKCDGLAKCYYAMSSSAQEQRCKFCFAFFFSPCSLLFTKSEKCVLRSLKYNLCWCYIHCFLGFSLFCLCFVLFTPRHWFMLLFQVVLITEIAFYMVCQSVDSTSYNMSRTCVLD